MSRMQSYSREELIGILVSMERKLGRRPKKSDIPEEIMPAYRKEFGKWLYALEAAGLRAPSERALARRNKYKRRHQ